MYVGACVCLHSNSCCYSFGVTLYHFSRRKGHIGQQQTTNKNNRIMKIVIVSMDNLSNTRKILIMVLVVYFLEKHEFSNKFPHKHYGFAETNRQILCFLSIDF